MVAFRTGIKVIKPRNKGITSGGDGFAPVAGWAVVGAGWWADGHDSPVIKIYFVKIHSILYSNHKIPSMTFAVDNFSYTVVQHDKFQGDLHK